MKTIQFLMLVIFFSNSALAQDKTEFVGAFTSENQIFIRWVKGNDNQLFNIYRKLSNDGSYIRINEVPVKLMTSRPEIMNLLGEDYPDFKKAFKLDYPEQIATIYQYQPGLLKFAAVYTPKLAVLLGEGFIDNTVLPNRTYYYRIELTDGTMTTKLVDDFEVKSESNKTAPPTNLRVESGSGVNDLFWDTHDKKTVGYFVYRSETGENGVFKKLNDWKLIFTQNKSTSNMMPNYVDKDVDTKKAYWYKVVGVNIFNEQGIFSATITPSQ